MYVRDALSWRLGLCPGQAPVAPPSESDISSFADGTGRGPSMNNFKLEYTASAKSLWNQTAFSAFGDWFGTLVRQQVFEEITPREYMTGAWFSEVASSKLRYLKQQYTERCPPPPGSNESVEGKKIRLSQQQRVDRAKQRRNRRKTTVCFIGECFIITS